MRSVNKVILIGRVGQEPEVNQTKGGQSVANISLATNQPWGDEETEWHRLVCWRKLADIVEQYVGKGDPIYVEGRLQYSEWQDDNGNKRTTAEVNVDQLVMLGGSGKSGGGTQSSSPPPKKKSTDDLPF